MEITTVREEPKLDEIEMCLQLLQIDHPHLLGSSTYAEIAELIEINFGVPCPVEFINLLYEPTIEQAQEDIRAHYRALGF